MGAVDLLPRTDVHMDGLQRYHAHIRPQPTVLETRSGTDDLMAHMPACTDSMVSPAYRHACPRVHMHDNVMDLRKGLSVIIW